MNAPFLRPAGCPAGVNPAEWRDAVAARIDQLQDAMLALIAALDAMEVDPDLEPSLAGGGPVSDDRERDLDIDEDDEGERLESDRNCDDEESDPGEDNADAEPSLGWSTWRGIFELSPELAAGWHPRSGSDVEEEV